MYDVTFSVEGHAEQNRPEVVGQLRSNDSLLGLTLSRKTVVKPGLVCANPTFLEV